MGAPHIPGRHSQSSHAILDIHFVRKIIHGGVKCIKLLQLSGQDIRPRVGNIIQTLRPAQQGLIRLWEAPHGEPAEKAKELEETMEIPEGWY